MKKSSKAIIALLFAGLLLGVPTKSLALDAAPTAANDTKERNWTIQGQILENSVQPLPIAGVNVLIKGTALGTISDTNGYFSIKAQKGDVIVFTYLGFRPYEYVVSRAISNLSVSLSEDSEALDEVVVTGFSEEKKLNSISSVSTLDITKNLNSKPITSISQSLQGGVTGLTVTQGSGMPGGDGASIKIRGISSLHTNNDPLVLVDGIPMDMNQLDPNTIESVTILKDAAAAAIYGARAANGVIVVKTKRGTVGKINVSYDGYFGVQKATYLPDFVNAAEYMTMANVAQKNIGGDELYSEELIKNTIAGTDPYKYPDTDWADFLFSTGYVQNHSVSVSGGGSLARFALSVNYMQNEGLTEHTSSDRLNIRANTTVSLRDNLSVNMEYMENLSEIGRQELLRQLDNRIFYNPMMKNYEIKDRFIAGNVVAKVEWIENYLKDYPEDEASKKSLEVLRAAVPEPISFELLDFNLGERWIPMSVYEEFAGYLFETKAHIHYTESIDEFSVNFESSNANITDKYYVKGEKRGYYGYDLLKHALHNTVPDITKTVQDEEGNDIKVRDAEAIQLADTKINEIRSAFTDWLNEQLPEFKQRLADLYNRKFNCYVRPDYDGSLQSFPFLDLKGLDIPDLYDSQKNAVWMLKMNGGGIIDHEVGTGKTLIMCIAAFEMKRLGMANKPMIIGLKSNVHDIADTFKKAYPNAKVLYPGKEDFTPEKRVGIFHDIKNNNWDCIILTHDQFGKIPQSPEIQQEIYTQEINNIEENLAVFEQQGNEVTGWIKNGLEKRKENLEAKLEKLEQDIKENEKLKEYKKIAELTKISCCIAQNCEVLNNAIKKV